MLSHETLQQALAELDRADESAPAAEAESSESSAAEVRQMTLLVASFRRCRCTLPAGVSRSRR